MPTDSLLTRKDETSSAATLPPRRVVQAATQYIKTHLGEKQLSGRAVASAIGYSERISIACLKANYKSRFSISSNRNAAKKRATCWRTAKSRFAKSRPIAALAAHRFSAPGFRACTANRPVIVVAMSGTRIYNEMNWMSLIQKECRDSNSIMPERLLRPC